MLSDEERLILSAEERMIFRHRVLSTDREIMFDNGIEVTPKIAYYVYLDNGGINVSAHKNPINSRTDIIGLLSAYVNPIWNKGKYCAYHVLQPRGLHKPKYLVSNPTGAKGNEPKEHQLYFNFGEEIKLVRNVKNGLEGDILFRIDKYSTLHGSE